MKIRELFEEEENTVGSLTINGKKVLLVSGRRKLWNGSFDCTNKNITSLEGSPLSTENSPFICVGNKRLKSLNGGPTETGAFLCSHCDLRTLEGAPQKIYGRFWCDNNPNLTSLKGMPQEDISTLFCANCNLTSLEGAPLKIDGSFECSSNKNLTSLKGAPQEGVENLDCKKCNLHTLEGVPKKINGNFNCSNNKNLTSLKGMPQEGVANLECSSCKLTSLEGAPKKINGNLICTNNPITSLKDIHKIIEEIKNFMIVPSSIESNILGVLKIKNLQNFNFFGKDGKYKKNEISNIINKYLPNPNASQILDCQNELIEAGFEEYAEL